VRFEELRLIAYGPFTDCILKLKPGLNVLYGPNEAGKSSALRAVRALLFGIGHKTSDDFVHNYQQLRVGGVLVDDRGERLECVRRKGRTATLRDGDDNEPLDESRLQAMLGGANEEFFSTVFGIDHERLREGGDDVVRGEGRIGELLFAAGGVRHLREKQQALEEHAAGLFKPRASNPRINAALSQLKKVGEEIRDLQQSPERWAEHDKEHGRLTELVDSLKGALEKTESARSRLERIQSSLGLLAAWRTKRAELETLAGVVTLPEDAEKRFKEASHQQSLADSEQRNSQQRISQLEERLLSLTVPTELLGEADRIDDLYLRLGSHQKASSDRVGLAAQQRTARDNAKRALERLGWEMTLDEVATHRLPDQKKARVRKLASQHGERSRVVHEQRQSLKKLRARCADLQKRLAGTPVLPSPRHLKEKLVAAIPALEVEDRLAEQQIQIEQITREAQEGLARLGHRKGSLEEVVLLNMPSEETVERFDASLRALQTQRATLEKQFQENLSESERVQQELAALELAESVPTEEELSALRAIRDRGVGLAIRLLEGGSADAEEVDELLHLVGEGSSLPSALQPSVRHADIVADRLRRESKRVAEKSQLLAKQAALLSKTEGLGEQRRQSESDQEAWDAEWRTCWQDASIDPATPAEMRSWLRRHDRLLGLAADLRSVKARQAADHQRVQASRDSLAAGLIDLGAEVRHDSSLRELTAISQKHVDEAESALRERQQLQSDHTRVMEEAREAEARLEEAEQELQSWREAWTEALQPLRLGPEALPEQAEAVLGNLDELFGALDEREDLGKRIWGIDKTAEEFRDAARAVCAAVASDLLERPVEEVASTLHRKLTEAKAVRREAEALHKQLQAEQQAFHDAENQRTASRAVLDALVREAGCTEHAELPAALQQSHRKRQLAAEVEDLRSQLAPFCAGNTLETFAADAEREDADRLSTQIAELDGDIGSLRDQRDEAIRAKEEAAGILRQYGGASAAADRAEEQQFLLSQLEEDARDYAIAVVAGRLLQRAVERYQEKSQGPVLAGASEYFAKLTCGAFAGLRTDLDDSGQQVLLGSRPGGVHLPVQAMSEGTRDQLYLALRLGTVDHWLDQHAAIPLVVDDILLTFDDRRAAATLEVLAAIAQRTQVLFFTHHEHLVSMVQENNGAAGGASLHLCETLR
jgi:uncharacterized protein YhaN